MIGPFLTEPIPNMTCSPVGMVPKKGTSEICRITHLSYPKGTSINSFIAPEDATTIYQTFDQVVQLVASFGKSAFISKADAKSAFCNIPMCFYDLQLLGVKFDSKVCIDCYLPFGAAISCTIFEDVANLI